MSHIGFDQSALDHYDIEAATHSDVPRRTPTDGWELDAVGPKNERRVSPSLVQYRGTYHSQHALPGIYHGSPLFLPQVTQEPLPQWPDSVNTSERSSPDDLSAPVTSPIDVSVLNIAPWMSNATHTTQPSPSPAWGGFHPGTVDDFANLFGNDSTFNEAGPSLEDPEAAISDEAYQIHATGTSANDGRFDTTPAPLQCPPTPAFDGSFKAPAINSFAAESNYPTTSGSKRKSNQQTDEGSDPPAKRHRCATEYKGIDSQPRLKPLLDKEVHIVTRADKLARTKKVGTEKQKNVVEKERRDYGTRKLNEVYSKAVKISDKYQPPEGVTDNTVDITFLNLIDDRDAQAARADDATAAIVLLKEENAHLADQRDASMSEIQRLRTELNAVRDQAGGRA